jgi:hypothetical protein
MDDDHAALTECISLALLRGVLASVGEGPELGTRLRLAAALATPLAHSDEQHARVRFMREGTCLSFAGLNDPRRRRRQRAL